MNTSRPSKVYKTLPQNQCPSECSVCGNQAIGYHYGAPSCNGCKIFFRRTIVKGRKRNCLKKNTCLSENVDLGLKIKDCPACRLEKCIRAGMNPLLIESKAITKKGETLRNELVDRRQIAGMGFTGPLVVAEESQLSRIIEKLQLIESRVEPMCLSGIPPGYRDVRQLEEILDSFPIFEVSKIPSLKKCPHPCNVGISNRQQTRNYVHSSFLASIEFLKMLDFFSEISLESKIRLVKQTSVVCSNIMREFHNVRFEKDDSNKLELENMVNLFTAQKIDKIEYLLLKTITHCNPAAPEMVFPDQEIVGKERIQYANVLLNYCLFQYGRLHGPSRFMEILGLTQSIEKHSKKQKDLYVYLNAIHSSEHRNLGQVVRKCTSFSYDGILES